MKRSIYHFVSEYIDLGYDIHSDKNIGDTIVEEEENSRLNLALSRLKDKYRIPIVLFYFKDLSYEDISEVMKLSMSTVKYRLHEAKKMLKIELQKYER